MFSVFYFFVKKLEKKPPLQVLATLNRADSTRCCWGLKDQQGL
jgi:hypothetical protein